MYMRHVVTYLVGTSGFVDRYNRGRAELHTALLELPIWDGGRS